VAGLAAWLGSALAVGLGATAPSAGAARLGPRWQWGWALTSAAGVLTTG